MLVDQSSSASAIMGTMEKIIRSVSSNDNILRVLFLFI